MLRYRIHLVPLACLSVLALSAQGPPGTRILAPEQARPQQPQRPQSPPQPQSSPPSPSAAAAPARTMEPGLFQLDNANLLEMVNVLAKMLKINIIVDPRVKGSVTVHTYGDVKPVELMPLLETILRVNGAAMVKVGDLYHIVPVNAVAELPLDPVVNAEAKNLPDDERVVLNLVFLKYVTAAEIEKLLKPFLGEGASESTYDPANLLILQDNSRNMKRTLELIALFDSDTFAAQRVQLFDVTNSRPTDLVKELDSVFKAYALSEKNGAVKFIPVDRINTVIAVAPNPGIFAQVQKWIDKLDVAVKSPAGAVSNYVYRLRYGQAATMAMAIMALYSGNPMALMALAQSANNSMYAQGMGVTTPGGGMGGGGMGGGMYGGGGYGNGYGGGMYGGAGMYGGGAGMYGNGSGAMYSGAGGSSYGNPQSAAAAAERNATTGAGAANDLTGSYLGQGGMGGANGERMPHVIPNPFDNTLLVQGTPQEWEQIKNLVDQLDVPPRQVLIDAKIYELDITDTQNVGVESYLTGTGATVTSSGGTTLTRTLTGAANAGGLTLTAGALVSSAKQLLGILTATGTNMKSREISAPSVIATDSIPATMNVGSQIPVLTSTAATGVQSGGTTAFANTISQQSTGITLSITARVNSSGIVTMMIGQQVSAPQTSGQSSQYSSINSPSFSNRSVSTQVTVQDGDTIAIGGGIQETWTQNSAGIPFLSKLPGVGALFGTKGYSKQRTELIIFLTPRVIYDTNQIVDATDELKKNLKGVGKYLTTDEK